MLTIISFNSKQELAEAFRQVEAETEQILKAAVAEDWIGHSPLPKETGNREREVIFRATILIERALAELPESHAQVAGWLQAIGWKGGKNGQDNALAKYLTAQLRTDLSWHEKALLPEVDNLEIYADALGTIIESPKYQMCLEPTPWQQIFIERLRAGDFKKLLDDDNR